jgi:hypothetical protein
MKATITKWLDWLKKATAEDDERLGHVYSDGEQLWATNGYVLHALDVATGRRGRVIAGEDGLLQVEDGTILPFAGTLPRGKARASIVVSAEFLRHAAEGQEGFVRLSIYEGPSALELSSGGKYALVMGMSGVPAAHFWKPGQQA